MLITALLTRTTTTKIECEIYCILIGRGGVEDTRLEAKDTKKIRGQGQPFRGQTLSRPRPRTKDTSTSALQKKKKSSQKFFRRSPQKNVFQSTPQDFNNQKIVLSSRTLPLLIGTADRYGTLLLALAYHILTV